ncbi:DUF6233 domain-containing protein [Streptomyces sp. NPDC057428]|uniref:DUF6233 domain-containing protein n=1 Tax=Streptomyces sp. NPDC057428 TaxID=3346129 RepID=UPI00368F0E5E
MSSPQSPEIPAPQAAPLVDVTMPDGQVLRGRLYERRQVADGWQFWIGLVLWRSPDPDRSEPGEYRAWMPAAQSRPVDDADYTDVPTVYLPPEIPTPPPSRVLPTPATSWLVVTERRAYTSEIQPTTVHRADCWGAREGEEITSVEEARAALSRPGARGCVLCGTDQSLQ